MSCGWLPRALSAESRRAQVYSHHLKLESRDRQCPVWWQSPSFAARGCWCKKGRLTWPPYQLLSSLSTLAGCLALVGPLILIRSGEIEGSLGELLWLTGGLLVWFFDIEAVIQGHWKTMPLATPLHDRTLGLAILAVLLAGWKCGLADRNWSWTNVIGWLLEHFLGRDGILLVVPRSRHSRRPRRAMILDGSARLD